MVEDGLIDLNTPIKQIIPEIEFENPWENTNPVRVVNLLEHSSGFDDVHLYEYFNINDDPQISLLKILEQNPALRKVRFKPGTQESYSNHGYVVAGYIMEKLTGMRFEDYLMTNIIRPIGMKTSEFDIKSLNEDFMSQGYTELKPTPFRYLYTRPASSLISSAKEMGLFIRFLLNKGIIDGKPLVSEGSIERMETVVSTLGAQSGLKIGSGLGMSIEYRKGFKCYGHSGMIPGYYARYVYIRDLDAGFVVLINSSDPTGPGKIFNLVYDYIIQGKIPTKKPSIKLSKSQLEQFTGKYELTISRGQLFSFVDALIGGRTVYERNDTLFLKEFMSEEEPLIPVTYKMFRRSSEPDGSIVFTKSGVKNVFIDNYFLFEKTSGWKLLFHQIFVFGNLIIILSSVFYALVWVPVFIFKKRLDKSRLLYSGNRIFSLLAVISLIVGIFAFSREPMDLLINASFKTIGTITFFVSTLLFALFSFISLIISIRNFKKPIKVLTKFYFLIVSISLTVMTIYLWINDIIGLRFWNY